MKARERFNKVLNGEKVDRLPAFEWATWWDLTLSEWEKQGLKSKMTVREISNHFGLDDNIQFWFREMTHDCPSARYHGGPIIFNEKDYDDIKKFLFSKENIEKSISEILKVKKEHEDGNIVIWLTVGGYFWFPRELLGIENHMYAFSDFPELIKKINQDLLTFHKNIIDEVYKVITPDFITFAEDMSYNGGSMISKSCFDEFVSPFYKEIIPYIHKKNVKVIVDSDGMIEPIIPWFAEVGIDGALPLERQSMVEVDRIKENYPEFILIGGFDKKVMDKGEKNIRLEFERLLPAMKKGYFIPSVDHQTPPNVSIEDYKLYVKLLFEYCEKACN